MPAPLVSSLAKKAGVSLERAEHLWDKARGIVDEGYDYTEDDDNYWKLTTGIFKKMLGLKEEGTMSEFDKAYAEILTEAKRDNSLQRYVTDPWYAEYKGGEPAEAAKVLIPMVDQVTGDMIEQVMRAGDFQAPGLYDALEKELMAMLKKKFDASYKRLVKGRR